jgi:hypothetical protein
MNGAMIFSQISKMSETRKDARPNLVGGNDGIVP